MPLTRTDAKKLEAERVQAILIELLREEENKYCADCEAKQPRWASWNLGVFLCIRCAGIHRNLGVHLTKVKSVNLDSWTPEQVQSMRVMGNKMARRVYEAELPEHFRRPQTYSALESFIRAKYEQKRYILKDWSPPPIDIKDLPLPLNKRHSSDRDLRPNMRKIDQNSDLFSKTRNIACNINVLKATIDAKSGIVSDVPPLLDLNSPKSPIEVDEGGIHLNNTTTGVSEDDCMEDFGPVVAAPPPNYHPDIFVTDAVPSSSNDKADIVISVSENNMEDLASVLEPKPTISEKKSTSDILALYGTAPKFYARIARQHGMEQFSEAPGEAIAFNEAENSIHSSDTSSPCYVPSVISVSQPNASPSGFTQLGYFGSSANTIPMRNFFLNHETATLFASASPFANVPIATTTNGVFSNSKTVPVEHMDISCSTALETRNSLDRFVTDLNCLNINGKSGERNNL